MELASKQKWIDNKSAAVYSIYNKYGKTFTKSMSFPYFIKQGPI